MEKDYRTRITLIGKYGKLVEGRTAFELENGTNSLGDMDQTDGDSDDDTDIPFV